MECEKTSVNNQRTVKPSSKFHGTKKEIKKKETKYAHPYAANRINLPSNFV